MSEQTGADRMVNVQLTARGRTVLDILKERYGVRSKAEALDLFLLKYEAEAVKDAERMIAVKQRAVRRGDKDAE